MDDDSASDSGTGWKALAELQYENRHYPQAYETGAVQGVVWCGVVWWVTAGLSRAMLWHLLTARMRIAVHAMCPSYLDPACSSPLQRCAACAGCTAAASAGMRR